MTNTTLLLFILFVPSTFIVALVFVQEATEHINGAPPSIYGIIAIGFSGQLKLTTTCCDDVVTFIGLLVWVIILLRFGAFAEVMLQLVHLPF